jgi:hypothetical protein
MSRLFEALTALKAESRLARVAAQTIPSAIPGAIPDAIPDAIPEMLERKLKTSRPRRASPFTEVPLPAGRRGSASPAEALPEAAAQPAGNGVAPALGIYASPESRLVAWTEPNSLGAEKFRALAARLDHLRGQRPLRSESLADSVTGVYGGFYAVRRKLAARLPDAAVLDDVLQPLGVIRQNLAAEADIERAGGHGQARDIRLCQCRDGPRRLLKILEPFPGKVDAQVGSGIANRRGELARSAAGVEDCPAAAVAERRADGVEFRNVERTEAGRTAAAKFGGGCCAVVAVAQLHLGFLQHAEVVAIRGQEAGNPRGNRNFAAARCAEQPAD